MFTPPNPHGNGLQSNRHSLKQCSFWWHHSGMEAGEKDFRTEIVQLRALAVLSVLLFHLKVPGFQGGFVGVDVFFVISGYLITRNILREAAAGRFSFGAFYLRRTRRIYPALIFTVFVTYLAGALWSAPLLLLFDIAKECTHALLSIANIQYWREASHYFAARSDELALLHCWSLSLEEQFYLVWPAVLIAAARTGNLRLAVILVTAASFIATIWVGPIDSSAAFFLMPFRIFRVRLRSGSSLRWSGSSPACITRIAFGWRSSRDHGQRAAVPSGNGETGTAGSHTVPRRCRSHLVRRCDLLLSRASVVSIPCRRNDLLFTLSLPLADHLLLAIRFRGSRGTGPPAS